MTAPSTAAGSTRCPGCNHRFTDDPRRTTTIPGTEYRGRPGYSSRGPGARAVEVDIRWHADCLTAFEAENEALREQVRADRRREIETLARAAGLDVDSTLAKFDAAQATS